jgi:hypothetical protein
MLFSYLRKHAALVRPGLSADGPSAASARVLRLSLADVSLDREIERRQVTADPDLQGPPLASRHVKACRKQLRQSGNRRFSEVQFAATHAGLVLIEDGLGSLGRPTKID